MSRCGKCLHPVQLLGPHVCCVDTIARLRALVRRLEWAGRSTPAGFAGCLVCGRFASDGHAPGCEIAEVLRG